LAGLNGDLRVVGRVPGHGEVGAAAAGGDLLVPVPVPVPVRSA
jgi:hypothetical protein